MSPRPAPDLEQRRDRIVGAAREVAASDGWPAVTMRRLAATIGVTQPVLYSAFPGGRQAVVDAVALDGFAAIAAALEAVDAEPLARMHAYLDFAGAQPHVYDAMFSMPSGLSFGAGGGPAPLQRAFAAVQDALPEPDDVAAEVLWAALHGLATLQNSGRLPPARAQARVDHLHRTLAG